MNGEAGAAPPWLEELGSSLVEALPRLYGEAADPLVAELLRALTEALGKGDLELCLEGPPPPGVSAARWPGGHRAALEVSVLAREPDGPLALEGQRLLWRRWQRQRQDVLDALVGRARPLPLPIDADAGADRRGAADLAGAHRLDARQRQAVAAALSQGLVLLEGGPGTGKTSTVAAMVAALRQGMPEARVHLAAPTGKAAARLRAATGGTLPCSTLHRLLESRGESFGRNRRHPLGLDLLVVDEVSMVDLALMQALLEALPGSCRLVLVGDPAQLPPVAPGAVLLELQRPERRGALGEAAITLGTAYRNEGAIAAVAADLRAAITAAAGAPPDPLAVIHRRLEGLGADANLRWIQAPTTSLPAVVGDRLRRHLEELAAGAGSCPPGDGEGAQALLALRDRLLVLAPQRRGRWGLDRIHQALLGESAQAPPALWPLGTPVLCRRNLPELGVANGDLGVVTGSRDGPARRLLFGERGSEPLWLHPAQLAGALEPAAALTVHKAQGSEAEEVIVLLPPRDPPIDPRLLYTALTRARRQLLLLTPADA